jgi:hypothetical protein
VLAALSTWSGDDKTVAFEQRVAPLIDGGIAAHSVNQSLHRVLLDEVPLVARSNLDAFEVEYQRRYQALVAASSRRRSRGHDDTAALAVEGVVHASAWRGELGSAVLRAELGKLVCTYLTSGFATDRVGERRTTKARR